MQTKTPTTRLKLRQRQRTLFRTTGFKVGEKAASEQVSHHIVLE